MSHFSKINATITDEEAMRAATQRMGLSLIPNGKCRYYYGTERADLLVKLPGDYDVALMKEGDHYSIKADFYGGHVAKYVGADAGLLTQSYAVEKAKMEAYKKALAVTETKDGSDIILTFTDTETGGQMIAICHEGGKIDIRTQGFPGQSCMQFKDLEAALGNLEEFKPTMEMYEAEPINGAEYIRDVLE